MQNTDRFLAFEQKMRADGLSDAAIRAFEHSFRALERNESGMILESGLDPADGLQSQEALPEPAAARWTELLQQTVIIKLNGGLGTGMGLEKAKSLLPVREGMSFLDLTAKQILHLRGTTGTPFPRFLLMNSFSTSEDSRQALSAHPALGDPAGLEFLQNRVPKVLVDSLLPAAWPQQRNLEWCPPGHGDIYPSLAGSGCLAQLLAQGVKYAFVSNSDNLGADLCPRLLSWFAESEAPFAMEVTRRTAMDRKGGHLARRKEDGRLVLRESAQCAAEDQAAFEDISRHRYFNTNNLWLRLDKLQVALEASGGAIPLPMIRNAKTIDPRDAKSPAVYQLETAMGAAIECFPGAQAIEVPRTRFAPVKTTADLVIVRSDACQLTPDFRIQLATSRAGVPPVVELDKNRHKLVDGLDELMPYGVPSLSEATSLKISGRIAFGADVIVKGNVEFRHTGPELATVAPGVYADQVVHLEG